MSEIRFAQFDAELVGPDGVLARGVATVEGVGCHKHHSPDASGYFMVYVPGPRFVSLSFHTPKALMCGEMSIRRTSDGATDKVIAFAMDGDSRSGYRVRLESDGMPTFLADESLMPVREQI